MDTKNLTLKELLAYKIALEKELDKVKKQIREIIKIKTNGR